MKIGTRKTVKNLLGKDILDEDGKANTIGKLISNILLLPRQKADDVFKNENIKPYQLAQKFFDDEFIELDDTDFDKVIKVLQTDESNYSKMIKAQCELHMISEKERNKKEKEIADKKESEKNKK